MAFECWWSYLLYFRCWMRKLWSIKMCWMLALTKSSKIWSATSQHWPAGHGKRTESCRVKGKGRWDKRAETGKTAPKWMTEAIQRKLRAIEYQKIEVEQREETLKRQVSGLEKVSGMMVWRENVCLFWN